MNIKNNFKNLFNYFKQLQEEESSIVSKTNFNQFLFLLGSVNIFLIFSILVLTGITFALGGSISQIQFFLALISTVIYSFFAAKVYYPKTVTTAAITLLLYSSIIFVVCAITSSQFYDLSYDGQSYHQDIIIRLAEGWNPFYQHITNDQSRIAGILNYYPKAAEIYSAAVFKITNSIEVSKLFQFFLMFTSFCFTFSVLLSLKRINNFLAFLISLLLVLNPVGLIQVFSFYIDGQVYQLLLSLISLSIILFTSKKSFTLIPLFSLLVILVDIKITGMVYAGLFILVLLIYSWYSEKIHFFAKVLMTITFAFIVALIFLGFNPFVTNTFYYGHPLHPALGKKSLDYVEINGPQNYQHKNSLYLLFHSLFSESDFLKGPNKNARLKPLLMITEREKMAFTSTDPIEGGFGPLLGPATILTFFIFLLSWFYKREKLVKVSLIIASVILISCLINSASFYARFIPQFWIIPVLAVLVGFSLPSLLTRALALMLILILAVNIVIVTSINWSTNYENSLQLRNQLKQIAKASEDNTLLINYGLFESNRIRFREAGVNFVEKRDGLECANQKRLLSSLIPESVIAVCDDSASLKL